MRNSSGRKHPFLRSIITTFLAVALMGDATHSEEHQNPHTNHREHIEEVRLRTTAVQQDRRSRGNVNGGKGGSDPQPQPRRDRQAQIIRRRVNQGTTAQ